MLLFIKGNTVGLSPLLKNALYFVVYNSLTQASRFWVWGCGVQLLCPPLPPPVELWL